MKYLYEAVFEPCEEGRYLASFPDLDLVTQGESLRDAAEMAADLLLTYLSAELSCGEEPPRAVFGHEVSEGGYAIGIMVECDEGSPEPAEMTAQEAADVLGVSKSRVYAMARDGVLKSRKVGCALLISTESVRRRFSEPRGAGRPPSRPAVAEA